jgi:hypothetical protein
MDYICEWYYISQSVLSSFIVNAEANTNMPAFLVFLSKDKFYNDLCLDLTGLEVELQTNNLR